MCIYNSYKFFAIKYSLIVSLYLVLTACSKASIEPVETKGYIKGDFAGEYLQYEEPLYTAMDQVDTVSHVYWSDSNSLSLIRNNSKVPTEGIEIKIFNYSLDSVQLPVEFSSTQRQAGYVEIKMRSYFTGSIDTSSIVLENNAFGGSSLDELKITITSKSNDVVKGTFEGKMRRTITTEVMEVKKGEFAIKIIKK